MRKELAGLGLSEKEADIYLACLKLGEATSQSLSKITNIKRSTVYDLCDSLKNKSLLSTSKKEGKTFFIAESPKKILQILKQKEERIKEIIPQLEEISNTISQKTEVNFYEGVQNIQNLSHEILNSKEILVYGNSKIAEKFLEHYGENFARKRVDKKIMLKGVLEPEVPTYMKSKDISKYTKIRTMANFENEKSAYFIFDDFLLIISFFGNVNAIKIKDKNIVNFQKNLFEQLWKIAKP